MTEVRAIGDRLSNIQLIEDCATLGYLRPEWPTLDMTYGRGTFWLNFRPDNLVTNDLDPGSDATYHQDFRHLPFQDNAFKAVVFDPPYKLNGTGGGTGPATGDKLYGVDDPYVSITDRHALMIVGLNEGERVLGDGYLLVKCMDQVSSGKVQWQTLMMAEAGRDFGLTLVDMLHVQGYRRQPLGRNQVHARRDYSTLLVFAKGRP